MRIYHGISREKHYFTSRAGGNFDIPYESFCSIVPRVCLEDLHISESSGRKIDDIMDQLVVDADLISMSITYELLADVNGCVAVGRQWRAVVAVVSIVVTGCAYMETV